MASTSASNGFAIFNGIQYLLAGNVDYQEATLELNNTIDLTNYPAVSIEFEQRYKAFNYDETYIDFSTDLGLTWQAIQVNDQVVTNDPAIQEVVELNVSSIIGGQANVKIRFRWISPTNDNSYGSGYGWMVDDLKITVPPNNDIQNLSSWIYGENNFGAEYGRTPIAHVDQNYTVGAYVYNYGALDQTNINVNGTFNGPTNFNTTASAPIVENDSSIYVESLNAVSFGVGIYNGEITVSSDGDSVGSDNFADNTYYRNFEITSDIYSLDGIGIHPAGTENIGSIGTASFQNNADGLFCATMYRLKQNDVINNVRVYITNSGTFSSVAGAEVSLYILDSTDMASGSFGNAYFISDIYTLTQNDISLGYIDIPVLFRNSDGSWSHLDVTPGNYYAAVELYSSANTFDIAILDDKTVTQPFWESAIYTPSDNTFYSNGNAFAIQLMLGANTSLDETILKNVTVYPNPSNGIINIKSSSDVLYVNIFDLSGKIVYKNTLNGNYTIDLSELDKGSYIVELRSSTGVFKETITIQ